MFVGLAAVAGCCLGGTAMGDRAMAVVWPFQAISGIEGCHCVQSANRMVQWNGQAAAVGDDCFVGHGAAAAQTTPAEERIFFILFKGMTILGSIDSTPPPFLF